MKIKIVVSEEIWYVGMSVQICISPANVFEIVDGFIFTNFIPERLKKYWKE